MGFAVSMTYSGWDIAIAIASILGALGTVAVFITYFHLKKRFKHELAKEDEKRAIDYRLIVLEQLVPISSFFLKELRKPEIKNLLFQEGITASDGCITNHKKEWYIEITEFYRQQNPRIQLFFAKFLEYPFIQADFPVSYRIMYNTTAVLDDLVQCSETHFKWNLIKIVGDIKQFDSFNKHFSDILSLTLGFVIKQLNSIIGSSQDRLWDLHLKELELRDEFPPISGRVPKNRDEYIQQLQLYKKHYNNNQDIDTICNLIREITDIEMINFQSTMSDDTSPPSSLSNLR